MSTALGATPLAEEEWQLEVTITDAPVVVANECDTSDGCESTCDSSCAS
ncbi:FxLD family lanthipeptide [Streptomyces sp. NPDC050732]